MVGLAVAVDTKYYLNGGSDRTRDTTGSVSAGAHKSAPETKRAIVAVDGKCFVLTEVVFRQFHWHLNALYYAHYSAVRLKQILITAVSL
jgi:hypothetical protein